MLEIIDSNASSPPSAGAGNFASSATLATRGQMRAGLMSRLLRQQSLRLFALLAAVEATLLFLAPLLAARLRFAGDSTAVAEALPLPLAQAAVFAIVIWISLAALGLYQRHGRLLKGVVVGTLTRLVLAIASASVVLMVIYFLLPAVELGRGVLALSLLLAFGSLIVTRLSFSPLIDGRRMRRRVLFLGNGGRAAELLGTRHFEDELPGVRIVGFADPSPKDDPINPGRRLVLTGPLVDVAFRHRIDDIVVAADDLRNGLSMDELMSCRLAGIEVLRLDSFYEREYGRVMLEGLLPSWFVFTARFNRSVLRRISKRSFDLLAAFTIALLSWPLMILVALAIWIESGGRGPVLYRQQRLGEGDLAFRLVKFRSMRTDAEMDGVARWASADDDRVTRVGRVIRKLRLDELPQLYNVLRGDMSMVGPRPERPEIVAELSRVIPYYRLRHSLSPGLTGWAQLRYPYGASVDDAREKLRYDLYYIKNQSLLFDLQILLQTVEVVLFRRGGR